ncbi:MAG: hypothetical protein DBP02_02030 [gamma proteobacterium symbiont of Ctena orbiculata]|nr:MAG: hypothetical protein DBP02_02030 [gamma proteobacterium symbiont of Ctena orbiculata]
MQGPRHSDDRFRCREAGAVSVGWIVSLEAVTWAYKQQGLKSGAKFLLVTLGNYADENSECYPGIKTLAKDTAMSPRSVIRAINELSESGHIQTIIRPGEGGGRKSNIYRLACSKLTEKAKCQSDTLGGQSANLSGGQCDNLSRQSANLSRQSAKLSPKPSEEPKEEPKDKNICSRQKKPTTAKQKPANPEDLELAMWIWGLIDGLAPGQKKPNFNTWADDIRKMREIDKRTHDDIKAVFEWAHNDSFWKTNIRSPSKLREKFDGLNTKRLNARQRNGHGKSTESFAEKNYEDGARLGVLAQFRQS